MKPIHITRDSSGNVVFEPISIDVTEDVFFINMDPGSEHWPSLITNPLGAFPSLNSSAFPISAPTPPIDVTYKCLTSGHGNEQGTISVFALLKAVNTKLSPATKGTQITPQQVVSGGKAPYTISGQTFQLINPTGQPVEGSIGPGLALQAGASNVGILVTGTPTVAGTYTFTFTVVDAMGRNLQQAQYSMVVS